MWRFARSDCDSDCFYEKFKQVTVDESCWYTLDQTSDLNGLTNKNKNIEAKSDTT